jgi:hypothetical protein
VVSECRAIKARQARRHLELEITALLSISDLETTDFTDYSDLSRSKKLPPSILFDELGVNQPNLWILVICKICGYFFSSVFGLSFAHRLN